MATENSRRHHAVSVLALSSRFDGLALRTGLIDGLSPFQYSLCRVVLMVFTSATRRVQSNPVSVLALSSRFDGPCQMTGEPANQIVFQYSLCRVVLMVNADVENSLSFIHRFQYSLCRVVLMVTWILDNQETIQGVSVLALSSRFDGLVTSISPRSVARMFQYSLCRVVLMVLRPSAIIFSLIMFQYSLCRVVLMVYP